MKGQGEFDGLDAEVDPEGIVIPIPFLVEERALKAELEQMNGKRADGPLSVISIPRPGGGWIFVSGQKTLFSNFRERAYVLGLDDAERLIRKFPNVLKNAKILMRRC